MRGKPAHDCRCLQVGEACLPYYLQVRVGLRHCLGVHPDPYSLALSLQAFWASISPSVKCILMSLCSKAIVRTQ